MGTTGRSTQRTLPGPSGPALPPFPVPSFGEVSQALQDKGSGQAGTRVGSRTPQFGVEQRPPRFPSVFLASPGSRGHSRGLTRFEKTCLRFGREAGWGLSTPFLLLLSQGIKFPSQQLRGKAESRKPPLNVSQVVPQRTCAWFSARNPTGHSWAGRGVRTSGLSRKEGVSTQVSGLKMNQNAPGADWDAHINQVHGRL